MGLYLVSRGLRPGHHKAPFHPVILCTQKWFARWEAGDSTRPAWIWENDDVPEPRGGWLLVRWNGLDIDYGGLVKSVTLPDGTHGAFWRDYSHTDTSNVVSILNGAVWWTAKKRIPPYLAAKGVVYPPDEFSQDTIIRHEQEGDPMKYTPWKKIQRPTWWDIEGANL